MPEMMVKIEGLDTVMRNILKIQEQIKSSTPTALTEAADKLRDYALYNLQANLGQSNPTWGRWGHSYGEAAISDKSSWLKSYPDWDQLLLESSSPHSAIVEFGGTRRIDNPNGMWPIGQSQGRPPIYRPSFHLQVGYHYLTNAIHNETAKKDMLYSMARIYSKAIRI